MAHVTFHCAFDQRPRIDGVVAIVAERLTHRVRHHDRRRKVDDGVDPVVTDEPRHQRLIAGLADDQRHAFGNRRAMSRREIVEDDHPLAGIDEVAHHLAADIAGAAGDQDRHGGTFYWKRPDFAIGAAELAAPRTATRTARPPAGE